LCCLRLLLHQPEVPAREASIFADGLTIGDGGKISIGAAGLGGGTCGNAVADEPYRTVSHQEQGAAAVLAAERQKRLSARGRGRRRRFFIQGTGLVASPQMHGKALPVWKII